MPSRRHRCNGSAYVEFVLVAAFFFVPLILGLLSIGFALSRSLQVAQLTRDVGRMFVRGIDFSQPSNQNILTGSSTSSTMPALARGLGMQGNGATRSALGGTAGNGVVILSVLTKLATSCNCTNGNHIVVTRRIVVGNRTLYTSAYGNPSSSLVNTTTGAITNYSSNTSVQADNFSNVVNLSAGDFAFVTESRFNFPDLAIAGIMSNPGVTWSAVF